MTARIAAVAATTLAVVLAIAVPASSQLPDLPLPRDRPPPSPAPSAPAKPRVLVATTGNHSELVGTIPIKRHGDKGRRVVMSMTPRTLPSLAPGDLLRATAEVLVTVDCYTRSARCAGALYRFNPRIEARLVLARSRHATGGARAVQIGEVDHSVCTQRRPHREHHCVITLSDADLQIGSAGSLPCASRTCRLNLVLSAHHRRARRGQRLVIGQNLPNGRIAQDSGRINAIRLRPASQPPAAKRRSGDRMREAVPVDLRWNVVFSQRLDDPRAGDQIEVEARMLSDVSHLDYSTLVSTRVTLARRPRAIGASKRVRRVASLRGEVTEKNGFNCTRAETPCLTEKVGVATIKRDPPRLRSGERMPIYVNFVTRSLAKRVVPKRGDRLRIVGGEGLEVIRYPASARG